jgi:periplasmic divalent cation tolerance protein
VLTLPTCLASLVFASGAKLASKSSLPDLGFARLAQNRPMSEAAYLAVVTTLPTRAAAQDLARALLAQRLAACAQITEIESFYVWDGALQQAPEWRLLLKTRATLYARLEAAIRAAHPYELPAIHALPLAAIDAAYAGWIDAQTDAV